MLVVFSGNCGRSLYHFRLAAVKRIQELGHQVIAILPQDDYIEKIKAHNIEVIILTEMQASGTNPLSDYKLYKEYINLYSQIHPDLIFEYTIKPHIYGTLAAKKLNIPCIAIVSGLGYSFTHKGIVSALAKQFYRFALRKTAQVWFSNNDDKLVFEEKGFVVKSKSILLNGEGIDTNHYSYAPIDYSKKSFILIGRLLFDKGVKEYYEAAKKLKKTYPEVSFKILGFINPKDPRSVSENQLNEWMKEGVIEYLGSTTDVKPFIKNSTCMVLPSYYKEGMSTALMEAASMGRPLIATNIAGCRELIDDGKTGYICEPKNADSLANKMELLINSDDDKLREMGIKSREKMIAEFDIENVLPKYENVIKGLTNKMNVLKVSYKQTLTKPV
jgi:glycosyltransferase involved in cell wall biosynthesis